MDRFTRGFVLASLVYFVVGSALGVHLGTGGSPLPFDARFAHVHLMLLGFMSMMVYGVGYFVLPRFNGKALRWEALVPLHFFVANAGLLGMIAAPRPSTLFLVTAGLNVVSAVLFGANLVATILLPEAPREEAAPEPSRPGAEALDPDMRVGEILETWPETVGIFAGNGFPSLADPEHREQVRKLPVTLRMACQRHNVDVDTMLARLAFAIGAAGAKGSSPSAAAAPSSIRPGEEIGADHVLGHILSTYPATEKVFRRYYGSGCFSCPGQATETVRQSALLHNVDMKALLAELNAARGR
jgi:hypothetical protein